MDKQANNTTTILLVEDERDLLDLLRYNLKREGFNVIAADTGEDALKFAKETFHHETKGLVLLDLMLPGIDGLEVCRVLKCHESTARVPVVMLTARGEESDIVKGLEMGADDYITKPFSPRVLIARIHAILRRAENSSPQKPGGLIQAGTIAMNLSRHEATAQGELVSLTATEFKLLTILITKAGRVFTRQQIIDRLHEGFAAVTDRSVDVQVVSLRRKLGASGEQIETVRGVGYRFRD